MLHISAVPSITYVESNMLNNRELSGLIWLAILFVWALTRDRAIWRSLLACMRSMLEPKLLTSFMLGAAWVAAFVLAAQRLGLWKTTLIGETALWFIITGVGGMFMSLTRLGSDQGFFTHMLARIFALSELAAGLVNLFVFPLWVELILTPALAILVGVSVVAKLKPKTQQVDRATQFLLAIAGATFVIYVIAKLALTWSPALGRDVGRALVLPIWLSLSWIPFLFVVSLLMAYEGTFLRIGFSTADADAKRRAQRAVITECRLNVHDVAGLQQPWLGRLVRARSNASVRRVLANYKRERGRHFIQ